MEHVFVIAGVIWLVVISPGAVFAMISRLSAVQGRRSGRIAAAGIATGMLVPCRICDFRLGIVLALSGPIEAGQLATGRRPIVADAGRERGRTPVIVPKRIGDIRNSVHLAEPARRARAATQDVEENYGA